MLDAIFDNGFQDRIKAQIEYKYLWRSPYRSNTLPYGLLTLVSKYQDRE